MELTLLRAVLVSLLVAFIYLFRTRQAFRYHVRFWTYYSIVLLSALVVIPFALCRPRDARNLSFVQIMWLQCFKVLPVDTEKKNCHILMDQKKPCVIVVNHQNELDIISLFRMLPNYSSFLAKRELLYYGTFGVAAWLCGLVFIDRLNRERAMDTMVQTARIINERNLKLWVFPEGTRNMDGSMLPFKKGAFHLAVQAQVPIFPVVLSSYRYFLDTKKQIFNPGHVIASCLPPVSTEGLTENDVTDLSEKVRDLMLQEFHQISSEVNAKVKAAGVEMLPE